MPQASADPSGNGVGALLQVALPGVPAWQLPETQTKADGAFRLQGVGAGPFALDIWVAEWGEAGLQSLYLRREFRTVPTAPIEIRVGEGESITGTLTAPDGELVDGLQLDVVPVGTDVQLRDDGFSAGRWSAICKRIRDECAAVGVEWTSSGPASTFDD